tara:strand:+ start:309 stop:632 length:324 start_codon:yes stop_codon:yes gene_type:complete
MANALETLKRMSRRDEGIYQQPDSTLVQQITEPVRTVDTLGANNPVSMMNLPQVNDPTSDSFMQMLNQILRARKSSIAYMSTSAFGTMTGMQTPQTTASPRNPYIDF